MRCKACFPGEVFGFTGRGYTQTGQRFYIRCEYLPQKSCCSVGVEFMREPGESKRPRSCINSISLLFAHKPTHDIRFSSSEDKSCTLLSETES